MEEWRKIEGYESYEISSLGRVRGKDKILKNQLAGAGYYMVSLYNKGKRSHTIHRLLGEAFIPNPLNLSDIDHINRIRTDNRLENLRWVSRSDNLINKTYTPSNTTERCIYKDGNLFYVRIKRSGQFVYRASFKTLEEAVAARDTFLAQEII